MCTVILRVPEVASDPVRMLAVRDEDPDRPWQPLGAWWPETHPGVVGVRDLRAGGAWLAAEQATGRIGVLLNRQSPPLPDGVTAVTRGTIALDAVDGVEIRPTVAVQGFNLVSIAPDGVRVVMWDGVERRELPVGPGTHMIAHDDLDDPRTARIVAWHGAFAAASTDDAQPHGGTRTVGGPDAPAWAGEWLEILARSGELEPTDERAIVRDNRPLGYPTQSTLLCVASAGPGGVEVEYGEFAHPGLWNDMRLRPPV